MSELYRCGWCGAPVTKEGEPLTMSQIGLTKDFDAWDSSKPTEGKGCCDAGLQSARDIENDYYNELGDL